MIKKETSAQAYSCEFRNFFQEYLYYRATPDGHFWIRNSFWKSNYLLSFFLFLCQTKITLFVYLLTLFRMDIFGAAHGWGLGGGAKRPPLPEVCHTYATMMKLVTVIPYLKKSSTWVLKPWVLLTSAFFYRKSANFAISRNTDRYRLYFDI